jgi:hypothetical protein
MNERIKELAEQAEIDYDLRPEIARTPLWIGTDEELEKFAELIIQRCIALCDGNHEHKNHTDTEFGKGVSTGIQLSQEAIKTHFGVEK